MKHLRNWENNTWLSSKKYIYKFSKFLTLNFNFEDMNTPIEGEWI